MCLFFFYVCICVLRNKRFLVGSARLASCYRTNFRFFILCTMVHIMKIQKAIKEERERERVRDGERKRIKVDTHTYTTRTLKRMFYQKQNLKFIVKDLNKQDKSRI